MKVNDVPVTPCEEVLVLPRTGGDNLVFIAKAVINLDDFKKLVPEPKPPKVLKKGGFVDDDESEDYRAQLHTYAELKFAYQVLKSLEPSNITWETVKADKPSTWPNWQKEMRDSGMSDTEINRVIVCVMDANSLNDAKLERARADFLRGREAKNESSGQRTEQPSTPSGEPASVST